MINSAPNVNQTLLTGIDENRKLTAGEIIFLERIVNPDENCVFLINERNNGYSKNRLLVAYNNQQRSESFDKLIIIS